MPYATYHPLRETETTIEQILEDWNCNLLSRKVAGLGAPRHTEPQFRWPWMSRVLVFFF